MPYELEGVNQVETEELKEILENDDNEKVILDVREPEEYEAGHIPGIPLVPMHTIPELVEAFREDKEYVLICRSGNRSQKVSLFLKANGIERVTNFNGGMLSWDGDIKAGKEHHLKSEKELTEWKK
ncbi:rhodanese-like domain-containing protein [Evansella clarkii]|jgi:rhodanese-related sulfurtransferase|uniref:rhodanese-like domain-containing protein n=1 Tax=Evansella clarkii TaxID=79879 RepID=UPI0009973259|nr:rhodanese-like domain-containing protein [Evansella clarkii]